MNGQKTVDEYIAAFDDWRTDAMKRLREIVGGPIPRWGSSGPSRSGSGTDR